MAIYNTCKKYSKCKMIKFTSPDEELEICKNCAYSSLEEYKSDYLFLHRKDKEEDK